MLALAIVSWNWVGILATDSLNSSHFGGRQLERFQLGGRNHKRLQTS